MDKKLLGELKDVKVTNEAELNQALIPFLDDSKSVRQLLMDGMNIAKKHQEYFEKISQEMPDADFGGYMPARQTGGHFLWVDLLIAKRLGGKRDKLKIVWSLKDGEFEFDPWTKKLTKNGNNN